MTHLAVPATLPPCVTNEINTGVLPVVGQVNPPPYTGIVFVYFIISMHLSFTVLLKL